MQAQQFNFSQKALIFVDRFVPRCFASRQYFPRLWKFYSADGGIMQKVVLNLPTAERPMLSHVFPACPDIGAVLENPSLASTEKQVDFDACHWLGREPWHCQRWIRCIKRFSCGTVFDQNLGDPTFHCLKKSSVLRCHLWLQKYFIQRPKSDFNISLRDSLSNG